MAKHDMSLNLSNVDHQFLKRFCLKHDIGPEYKPTAPPPDHRVTDCPSGYIAVYTKHFEFSNLRTPFSFFLLEFLNQYHLNISQLSPLGAIKVSHFEIACRALGGNPSLPLFRQFFQLARSGDWYTVEKRRNRAPSCVSFVPSSLKDWKDYFFWVSANVIPFKMHWRKPDEPLNVVDSRNEEFDEKLFGLLVKHPMPLQPFPEHVLIMTGVSRNWPYLNAEPILKDGDKEMGLVKFIEKKNGVGDVKLTRRFLAKHEVNILDRTIGVCYEGPGGQTPKSEFQSNVPENDSDPLVVPEIGKETICNGRKRRLPNVLVSFLKKRKVVTGNVVRKTPLTLEKENQFL